jgi:hypothetical protein
VGQVPIAVVYSGAFPTAVVVTAYIYFPHKREQETIMAIDDKRDILHKIKVKLYHNYLHNVDGTYIARTVNEDTLSIEDICVTLKNRGGFGGKFDDLVDHVRQFFDELVYQLLDGYAVSTGYFSLHPNIGGAFNSENEIHDHKKHPITFRFRTRKPLSELAKAISVEVQGIADVSGYIGEFIDFDEDSVNTMFLPGDQFAIHGHKIKIAGDDPGVGVFFVPTDASEPAVKVSRVAENTATKITGIAPDSGYAYNRIEIRTQYTGTSDKFLKAPRAITSSFVLEHA